MDLETLGRLVRDARKSARLTQADLGGMAGLSRSVVARLETGELDELGWTKAASLLRVLEMDIQVRPGGRRRTPQLDDLLEGSEDDAPPPPTP